MTRLESLHRYQLKKKKNERPCKESIHIFPKSLTVSFTCLFSYCLSGPLSTEEATSETENRSRGLCSSSPTFSQRSCMIISVFNEVLHNISLKKYFTTKNNID